MSEAQMRHPLPVLAQLPAEPDQTFDQFAALTKRLIGVPTALVSLVDQSRQVLPGGVGLPAPVDRDREIPLSHSFCQHVVISGEPLIVTDARSDPRVRDNPAVLELGVIAYAGVPLTSLDGVVVGSLCAIDSQPRTWSEDDVLSLTQMASACSAELTQRAAIGARARADERDRLVNALQDVVITDLLGATLTAAQLGSLVSGRAAEMSDQLLHELDSVLRRLRDAVHDRSANL
jgi:GAF domain-containing protein